MTARQTLPQAAPVTTIDYQDHYTLPPRKSWLRRWFLRLLLLGAGGFLLASIFLANICGAREPASRIKCANNLRQIALAAIMYANEHHSAFPATLDDLTSEELSAGVFNCPSDREAPETLVATGLKKGVSYYYVGAGIKPDIEQSDTVVIAYEPLSNHANDGMTIHFESLADHKSDGMNVAFADAHVEWIPAPDVGPILKQAAAGIRPIRFPENPVTQPR